MRWTTPNSWIYRAGHRWLSLRQRTGPRRRALAAAAVPPRASAPVLYLANGRLGDALLAAAFTQHYRTWFGPVLAVGRPETEAVVAPLVDEFVPFEPAAPADSPRGTRALVDVARRGCRAVVGDLHLFHGGGPLLQLGAATGAPMLAYDGWIDRDKQAPLRRFPHGAHVVPALDKRSATADAERLHVWHDLLHYHGAVLAQFALSAELPAAPCLPEVVLGGDTQDAAAIAALQLPPGHVACHAQSSQPKKDWPLAQFAAVFAAHPDVTFAVLGTDRSTPLPPLSNLRDLRGQTSVRQALAIAASARAFVGIDSGLAHAAAIASVPTVVVMPAATLGYFFPYPQSFGRHVHVVWSQQHRDCAGCGGICVHEPIWRSHREGFPCLRAVPVDEVIAALRKSLAPRAPR